MTLPPLSRTFMASIIRQVEKKIEESEDRGQVDEDCFPMYGSSVVPKKSIAEYILRLEKYFNCSETCFIMAIVYIERILTKYNADLTKFNAHRFFYISLLTATKFWDDDTYTLSYYSKAGALRLQESKELEADFLHKLDWKLSCDHKTFKNICNRYAIKFDMTSEDYFGS